MASPETVKKRISYTLSNANCSNCKHSSYYVIGCHNKHVLSICDEGMTYLPIRSDGKCTFWTSRGNKTTNAWE